MSNDVPHHSPHSIKDPQASSKFYKQQLTLFSIEKEVHSELAASLEILYNYTDKHHNYSILASAAVGSNRQ